MTYAIELENFAKILCGYFLQIITLVFVYIFSFIWDLDWSLVV